MSRTERGTALLVVALLAAASATASATLATLAYNAVRSHASEHASLCAYYASVSAFTLAAPGAPSRGRERSFKFTLGRDAVRARVALAAQGSCRLHAEGYCRGASARSVRDVTPELWCPTATVGG